MDGLLEALHADLSRHFQGELFFDPLQRDLYSGDASLFQVQPRTVAFPSSEDDLLRLIQSAYAHGIPLAARGMGLGSSGESLCDGLIVDFSRHWNEILEVADESVTVQAGATLAEIHRHLAQIGRRIGAIPSEWETGTVGAWIAVDPFQSFGRPSERLLSFRAILDTGERVDSAQLQNSPSSRVPEIAEGLKTLFDKNAELLRQPSVSARALRMGNLSSYPSESEIPAWMRLLVGTEGILGLFADFTFRTEPIPLGRAAALFGFHRMADALEAIGSFRLDSMSTATIFDRRSLSLIVRPSSEWDKRIANDCEAVLFASWEGDTPQEASEAATTGIEFLQHQKSQTAWVLPGIEESDYLLWSKLRREAERARKRLGNEPRPLPAANDLSVGLDRLPEFLRRAGEILSARDCTASLKIEGTTGQVDLRPILDFGREEDSSRLWPLVDRLNALAIELGGGITGSGGFGLAGTPWTAAQLGASYPLWQEIKRIFDPKNLLNPGKIVGLDPKRPAWPVRTTAKNNTSKLKISLSVADSCHGCGDCKTTAYSERMCPPFRADRTEIASPRGMMRALQHFGSLPIEEEIDEKDLRETAKACIQCGQCRTGCPVGIDIPRLMLETRIASWQEDGPRRGEWFASRTDRWLRWASRVPRPGNFLLGSSLFRRLTGWFTGLSGHLSFPRAPIARRPFHNRRTLQPLPPADFGESVLVLVGSSANYLNPALARTAIAVLLHNRIRVELPPRHVPSLAASLFSGDLQYTKKLLKPHLALLDRFVRDGGRIVCLEPSDATVLREYLALSFPEEADTKQIASHTFELTDYLNRLRDKGQLQADFRPAETELAYHLPCHRKRNGSADSLPSWLSEIPGLKTNSLDRGCTGMAGVFGLQKANRALSEKIAEPFQIAFKETKHEFALSECSACRLRMRQFTDRPVKHPIEILAEAYGLAVGSFP